MAEPLHAVRLGRDREPPDGARRRQQPGGLRRRRVHRGRRVLPAQQGRLCVRPFRPAGAGPPLPAHDLGIRRVPRRAARDLRRDASTTTPRRRGTRSGRRRSSTGPTTAARWRSCRWSPRSRGTAGRPGRRSRRARPTTSPTARAAVVSPVAELAQAWNYGRPAAPLRELLDDDARCRPTRRSTRARPRALPRQSEPRAARRATTPRSASAVTRGWTGQAAVFYRRDDNLVDWTYTTGSSAGRPTRSTSTPRASSWSPATPGASSPRCSATRRSRRARTTWGRRVTASFYALNYARQRFTAAFTLRTHGDLELRLDNAARIQEPDSLRTRAATTRSSARSASTGTRRRAASSSSRSWSTTSGTARSSRCPACRRRAGSCLLAQPTVGRRMPEIHSSTRVPRPLVGAQSPTLVEPAMDAALAAPRPRCAAIEGRSGAPDLREHLPRPGRGHRRA